MTKGRSFISSRRSNLLIRSKSVSGGWDDEIHDGDDHDGDQDDGRRDCSTAREAVADARREAAAAQARLAEAAVRYADLRIADETASHARVGLRAPKRPKPGEFVADELSLHACVISPTRCVACSPAPADWPPACPTVWEAFRRGDVDAEQIR